jgi:2'-5' RNA ligase
MTMLSIPIPQNISEILQSIIINRKLVRADPSDHCTLFYFEDDMNIETVLKVIPLIFEITQNVKPFIINFDSYQNFPEGKYGFPYVCQLKSTELLKLREQIKKIFDKNNIKFSNKFPKFIPHITVGYYSEDINKKKFNEIAFPVNKISLYVNSDNKEKETMYVEFPFGNVIKNSSSFIDEFAKHFEKLAVNGKKIIKDKE